MTAGTDKIQSQEVSLCQQLPLCLCQQLPLCLCQQLPLCLCQQLPLCLCQQLPLCLCQQLPLCLCQQLPLCLCQQLPLCLCQQLPLCLQMVAGDIIELKLENQTKTFSTTTSDAHQWDITVTRGAAMAQIPGMHMGHFRWTVTVSCLDDPSLIPQFTIIMSGHASTDTQEFIGRSGDIVHIRLQSWARANAQ